MFKWFKMMIDTHYDVMFGITRSELVVLYLKSQEKIKINKVDNID